MNGRSRCVWILLRQGSLAAHFRYLRFQPSIFWQTVYLRKSHLREIDCTQNSDDGCSDGRCRFPSLLPFAQSNLWNLFSTFHFFFFIFLSLLLRISFSSSLPSLPSFPSFPSLPSSTFHRKYQRKEIRESARTCVQGGNWESFDKDIVGKMSQLKRIKQSHYRRGSDGKFRNSKISKTMFVLSFHLFLSSLFIILSLFLLTVLNSV